MPLPLHCVSAPSIKTLEVSSQPLMCFRPLSKKTAFPLLVALTSLCARPRTPDLEALKPQRFCAAEKDAALDLSAAQMPGFRCGMWGVGEHAEAAVSEAPVGYSCEK